jgi:formate/nitrite transporter FocA (FNT family)
MASDTDRLFPGEFFISAGVLGNLVRGGVPIGLYYACVNDDPRFRA